MFINLNFSTNGLGQIFSLFILASTEMFCLQPNARMKSKMIFNEPSDFKKKFLAVYQEQFCLCSMFVRNVVF